MDTKLAASLQNSRQKYERLYADFLVQRAQLDAMREAVAALEKVVDETLKIIELMKDNE